MERKEGGGRERAFSPPHPLSASSVFRRSATPVAAAAASRGMRRRFDGGKGASDGGEKEC